MIDAALVLEHPIHEFLEIRQELRAEHELRVGDEVVVQAHRDRCRCQAEESAGPDDLEDVDARRLDGGDLVVVREPAVYEVGGKQRGGGNGVGKRIGDDERYGGQHLGGAQSALRRFRNDAGQQDQPGQRDQRHQENLE